MLAIGTFKTKCIFLEDKVKSIIQIIASVSLQSFVKDKKRDSGFGARK